MKEFCNGEQWTGAEQRRDCVSEGPDTAEGKTKCVWDAEGWWVHHVQYQREDNDDHEEARHSESFVTCRTGRRLGRSVVA
ncbi:uncharacterized [Tachysurus ichikawai]